MFPSSLRPYPDEIRPVPEHLYSTKLLNDLHLGDKDGSESARPIPYLGLKEQPLLRAVCPPEDGHFCVCMNLQPCQLKLHIEKCVGQLGLDFEAPGRLCSCRPEVTEEAGHTDYSQGPVSLPTGPLCTSQLLDWTG